MPYCQWQCWVMRPFPRSPHDPLARVTARATECQWQCQLASAALPHHTSNCTMPVLVAVPYCHAPMPSTPCLCATGTLPGSDAPWQCATATSRIKLRRASGALPRTTLHGRRARGALPRRCAVRTRGSAPVRPHAVRHTAVRHCQAVAHGSALLPRAWTRPLLQCYREPVLQIYYPAYHTLYR